MSVNVNSFPIQCYVIASAALTRDRVLHFLPRKENFYSLNFHVIDGYIILKSVFLPNTWTGQQYQYLKHSGDNPVANKKMPGQVVTNFTRQVVTSCECVYYNTIVIYTIHPRKLHGKNLFLKNYRIVPKLRI